MEGKENRGVSGDNQHNFTEGMHMCPASVVTFCDGLQAWLISIEQQISSIWISAKHLTLSHKTSLSLNRAVVFDRWITCCIRNRLDGPQRVVVKSSMSNRRSVTIYIPHRSVLGPVSVNNSVILEEFH